MVSRLYVTNFFYEILEEKKNCDENLIACAVFSCGMVYDQGRQFFVSMFILWIYCFGSYKSFCIWFENSEISKMLAYDFF